MSDRGWLTPLDQAESALTCGAKAFNLGRLTRSGYRVPQGLVIKDRALEEHLRASGLSETCRDLFVDLRIAKPAELFARAELVRAGIVEAPLPHDLRVALNHAYASPWQGKRVAVRSSAACEDSDNASFAGQLDTVLDVGDLSGIEAAVRVVWASLWSDRCLSYARRHRLGQSRMGVIIQEMVEARHSGVLFTRDFRTSGAPDDLLIEYVEGLGDGLVSGALSPARVRVRRADLAVTTEDDGAIAQLPAAQLRELARVALDLERNFGKPQDIEWSIDVEGRIVLLQSRPITAPDPRPTSVVWSNANIAENFPEPVSPFLHSFVARGYTAYFRNLGLSLGISPARIAIMAEPLENIVGVQCGRLYYNLTNIHTLIRLAPFGPWLARCFNEFTGAIEVPDVHVPAEGSVRRASELFRICVKTIGQYVFIQRRVQEFERIVDRYAADTHPTKLGEHTPRELLRDLRGFLDIRLNRWNGAALADLAAMVCYGLLKLALLRWLPGEQTKPHNDLLKGLQGLASARPIADLWRLSRIARQDPALVELFRRETPETLLNKLEEPRWRDFRRLLDRHIDEWSFRYSRELMLTCPTPQEDPTAVIRVLQGYTRESEPGPEEIGKAQTSERRRATDRIAARLTPSPLWRRLPISRAGRFRLLLNATQGSIRLRERARMKQALLYTRLRHVMLGIGAALVRQGQLERRQDIFFLTTGEVLDLLPGVALLPDTTLRLVALRRAKHAIVVAAVPPDSFILPWGECWRPEMTLPDGDQTATTALRGTSACGGIAEGNAAVVVDVAESERLRAGDILVTKQTDPGWATVLFLVKGLVVERGGMLSHGAIIAREYGIPAVVGVREATSRIPSGERLRVNGDRGVVDLVDG